MNIVSAIKNGDHLVFQQVFNEYHEKLYFFILGKTKSEYLAEEVVQITFIKLWNYKSSLKEEYTISTQLFKIATTTLIDLLRKQNNHIAMIKELTLLKSDAAMQSIDNLSEKELLKKISETINEMPKVQRKVFELSRIEGMSYKQIAEKLSLSSKTVEVHISRALKRIRKQLPVFILLGIVLFIFLKSKG